VCLSVSISELSISRISSIIAGYLIEDINQIIDVVEKSDLPDGDSELIPVDRITDFSIALGNGDILNLANLLDGERAANLGECLSFLYDGSNTVMSVRTNGLGSDITQQVVLEGIDSTANNSLSADAIISNLINNNQLIIDT
tara:strand:+ start:631 stop:1056 length:426 start_codon:yes stop_codon:yes gene_type:complete